MSALLPLDEDSRRQAASVLDMAVCVEAAAGTGKTRLIEDRIVEIVDKGTSIERVVAITFTEAAAAELRARIRGRLARETTNSVDDASRQRFRQSLASLDSARVETIHAFAQSLLRERPVEAGIDPGFEVLDPLGMDLDLDAAWDEWFGLTLEGSSAPVENALFLGFAFNQIKGLAKFLNRNRDLLPLTFSAIPPIDLAAYRQHLAEGVAELDALRSSCLHPAEDDGHAHILAIIDYHARIQAASDADALQILANDFVIKAQGAQKNWRTPDDCRRQKELCDELAAAQKELADHVRSQALQDLIGWLEPFPAWYDQRRRRLGKLDFDDLLLLTRNLLRDNKPVREYFQERFQYLLVDEFQDTDPLQMEIVFFLSEKRPARANEWSEVELDGGKLFVVGDPKQSIYRFRRADIVMYDAARKAIEKQGMVAKVFQNFRCAEPILDWANEVFSESMDGREGVQPAYIDLVPWPERQLPLEGPAVSQLQPPPGTTGLINDIRRVEATTLAGLIEHEIVGRWQVEEAKHVRPAEHRDILILVPTRTGLDLFEQVFHDWGIVYRHEGGNFFYRRQEVRDLIAYLSAIDNPSDQRAVVATLRHAYGIPDEDLLLHRTAGGTLDFRHPQPAAVRAVNDAFVDLNRFHSERNDVSLGRLVEDIVATTRMIELNLVLPHRRQAVANIYKVTQLARQYETQPGATLHRFVRWLRDNRDEGAREADSPFSGSPGKEVQILTMHMAKGLEFPIVILANLGSTFSRSDQEYVDRDERRVHIKRSGGFKTPNFDEASLREQDRLSAERFRLLYVAATRARDHLVVSAFGKPNDENWLSLFGSHTSSLPVLALPSPIAVNEQHEPEEEADYPVDELVVARDRWVDAREALLTSLPHTPVVTASALVSSRAEDVLKTVSAAPGELVPGGEAARLGSALHSVLEQLPSLDRSPQALVDITAAISAEHQIGHRLDELRSLVAATLDSKVVARALRSGSAWREVPFSFPLNNAVVEGSIDLAFVEEGGLVLADFKSDNVTAAEVQGRADHYRAQAALYTLACERLSGQKVREFIFLFARPGLEVAISGEGLAREALDILERHNAAA